MDETPERTARDSLRERYFPQGDPTLEELRALIIARHEAQELEDREELLAWYGEKREETPPPRSRRKLWGNAVYTVFILALILAGVLGTIFFMNHKKPYDGGDHIVVCLVGGETFTGDDCDQGRLPGM